MEYYKDDFVWERKAKVSLRIVIVGSGIGGLVTSIGLAQCGHQVILLEQVAKLTEVGAGIQVAPNSTRILGRFGLLKEVSNYTTFLRENRVNRWENGEQLSTTPFMPEMAENFHAPGGVIHRGDLQMVLLKGAQNAGVVIRTGAQVTRVHDNFEPQVQLSSGEWVSGDVVIAADGVKSIIRSQIAASNGQADHPLPTGDAAYRILIAREALKNDEKALRFFDQNVSTRWIGPGGHVITYPLRNRSNPVLNMALLHPRHNGSENDESWNRKGDKNEMLDFYQEWDETIKRLMKYVPEGEVVEWMLNTHEPLQSWHQNKVILLGDACHPMLPYVAQGAAQAIEDAGVLVVLFSLLISKTEISEAVLVYEKVRKARGERIQASASSNKNSLHLPDGPQQRARDEKIKAAQRGEVESPDLFGNKNWQAFMWGTDVMKQAIEEWEDLRKEIDGRLQDR